MLQLQREHYLTSEATADLQPWPTWQLWPGETFVVIGSGPSLTLRQVADVWRTRVLGKVRVITVNTSYQAAPWADALYACDYKFFEWHANTIFARQGDFGFMGLKITPDRKAAETWPRLKWVVGVDKPGFSTEPGIIHYGKNSGYQAVNLAYLMGAKKILLVGFDHHFPRNEAHWHGDHPDKVRSWYERWIPGWQTVADQLPAIGLEIVNCTPDSALKMFKSGNLENELI